MLDLAVIGGTVVDGTGGPPRGADVGIVDGAIRRVAPPGRLGEARATVDASGRIVVPGFVDPHTHMDAQLWWDPSGKPSVLHGVTTVVIGSCGFGVAPLRPGTEEYVLRSLEAVEEIPYAATRVGVPMSWRTWGEFFAGLGRLPLGVNVAGFVPHSALRIAVPGAGTDRMVAELREAVEEGAVGLSSSRGTNHTDARGQPVPSRSASDEELEALLSACNGRAWQINIRAKGDATDEGLRRALDELDGYAGMSRRAGARLTWTPLVAGPGDRRVWRELLDFSLSCGDVMTPQTCAQAIHSAISFDGPSYAAMVDGWAPAFAGYGDLSHTARRCLLADEGFRSALRAVPQDCSRVTAPCFDRWRVAVSPTNPAAVGAAVSELAAGLGVHPVDAMLDLTLADDLATVIEAPLSNLDDDSVRTLVASAGTLLGIGDAGAHVRSITNYSYPTHVLGELVGRRGWLGLPEAVHKLTGQPAHLLGLPRRGLVAEGFAADLCVIDMARLAAGPARLVADLPGGARRLHRDATGYDAVVVNGSVTVSGDRLTGARRGRLVRV